jgi:hypothetical protein
MYSTGFLTMAIAVLKTLVIGSRDVPICEGIGVGAEVGVPAAVGAESESLAPQDLQKTASSALLAPQFGQYKRGRSAIAGI